MTTMTVNECVSNIQLAKDNISEWVRSALQYYRVNHGKIPTRIDMVNETANILLSKIRKVNTYSHDFIIEEITKYTDLVEKTKDTNYLVIYKEYMYSLQMELQRRLLVVEEE